MVDGRYRITELLGTGGMGAVYEADHLGLGRKVAIKVIDREHAQVDQVASRFTREARAASSIESEHIVSVHDAGTSDGRPYLVMELLRGEDLGRRLRRCGKLPVAETLHIVAQTLRGLADAHEARIVHRDLKPDNVFLVSRKSDESFVKIVDFGVSKIERVGSSNTQPAITRAGTVIGTPLYMSPEQAQAYPDLDARSDLYSVGAIMFECLTGRPPHVGESYGQIILSICMTDAPDVRSIVPEVPQEIARIVERALRRDRARRFTSARQMLVALTTLPGGGEARAGAGEVLARAGEGLPRGEEARAGAAARLTAESWPEAPFGSSDAGGEPLGAKTLLAGGSAEPRVLPVEPRVLPVEGRVLAAEEASRQRAEEPSKTAVMRPVLTSEPSEPEVRAPEARSEPQTLGRTQAEWSSGSGTGPSPFVRRRPAVRLATVIATGILATVAGAGLTMWSLTTFFAPSVPVHRGAAARSGQIVPGRGAGTDAAPEETREADAAKEPSVDEKTPAP